MKKLLIALVALVPTLAFAAGGGAPLEKANIDLNDQESLQRGLDLFQNNCAGCHSTQYQRYERVATDLGIPLDEMRAKYLPEGTKIGELMENAIPDADAAKWFGASPPDLTLVARVRGEDWIYSYLHGFYEDESRPFGVNNTIFPSVGMPHVLEGLQGLPVKQEDGTLVATGGTLSPEEYDQVVRDITGFLVYSGDPIKLERERLGWWVMGFLFIFFVVAYLLKKEYWKDVH
ncbi:cytochrome c1 [Shewanella schlegeliana]|uniref:Cytochrome c1 n=1 Tax=Shewanella schlegeliana TaxID=190308 RepID=A0ABS1SW77_9GAMM|nr:cytochrome c1 [Shewanella schlegeliana]MBL4912772.1 cytochrome c1 [Shewanella schlegeliana]MCL1111887.1 cytochrome c1 [Shewanella schlegeliana]GIU30600.1 cytochrome c [Shewanella schlegeliana]